MVKRKQPLTAATQVAPIEKLSTKTDGTLADEASLISITAPKYNSIEYSDNYSDTSGS